ncbi:hypothetical protein [uncultured Sneathia sp.]|uniref:hypothetical protein n=1 Tax=uncultured Sneathia sp. TaxID=278067 RepID=UPI00259BDFBD|nr:hypothetical protein [uncultured Sneathia sp.]
MKKTLLLASLITTISMASTGFVESNFKGDLNFTKADDTTVFTGNLDELSLKGEVKVNKLTLGAVLKNKDIKEISKVKPLTTEMYTENLLDNSSVYAKYELPKFAGIKSYVKGTLNPKVKYEADGTLNFKKGNVELEGQLAHSFSNGAEVSLTSKTTFPFEKKDGEYGKAASSEHTLKLGAKKLNNFEDLEASLTIGHVYAKDGFRKAELNAKGTYVGLKDTKLNGEFNFIDEKEDDGKTDKNMAVSLKAGANYKGIKDLELDGKFNFKYQVKGTSKVKDIITDSDIVLNKDAYAHSYELDAKYTGVKDLELTAGAFVQHIHFDEGGLGNYVANPSEWLYAKSLVSNDKDFFAKHKEELEKAKKEYEKALETIKNTKTEDKKKYNDNKEIYDKLIEAKKLQLDEEIKSAKAIYDSITDEKDKATAKKAYETQVKINNLELKTGELSTKLSNIHFQLEKLQLEKKTEKEEEIDKLLEESKKQVQELTKDKEDKGLFTFLYSLTKSAIVNTVREFVPSAIPYTPEEKGKKLAKAEYNKEVFLHEEKENKKIKNIIKDLVFKKEADGSYKIATSGNVKANDVYKDITSSKYAQALATKESHENYSKNKYNEAINTLSEYKAKIDLVNFGFKLGTKYTGVKNLTLTADGVFAGRHHSGYDQLLKFKPYTTGYVKLHTGAKYDFNLLNNKLVVSPEANVTATFADIYAGMVNPSLVLAPKVSVEYNPMETLKVAGSVEVPVKFGLNQFEEFGYRSTSIKGALNMKYEWK